MQNVLRWQNVCNYEVALDSIIERDPNSTKPLLLKKDDRSVRRMTLVFGLPRKLHVMNQLLVDYI